MVMAKQTQSYTTKIAYFVWLFWPAAASRLTDVIQERNGWTGERVVEAKAQWWMGKPRLAQVIWSSRLGTVVLIVKEINAACGWKESGCSTQLCVVLECMAADQLGCSPMQTRLGKWQDIKKLLWTFWCSIPAQGCFHSKSGCNSTQLFLDDARKRPICFW